MEPLSAFFWANFKNTASSMVLKSERTAFDKNLLEKFGERPVCCSRKIRSACQRRTCLWGVVPHMSLAGQQSATIIIQCQSTGFRATVDWIWLYNRKMKKIYFNGSGLNVVRNGFRTFGICPNTEPSIQVWFGPASEPEP